MSNERILVVDDSQDNRLFLTKYILEPAGYTVYAARDGYEGLEMAIELLPDLLLLDLQMPRLSGIDVMRVLHERNIQIPIILITFHGSEEIIINVFRMGAKDYIIKPYTPKEILDSVEKALTETRLRKERADLVSKLVQTNKLLKRHLRELNALAGIGRTVTALMESKLLLCRIIEGAVYLVRGNQGAIILYHPDTQALFIHAEIGTDQASAKAVSRQVDDPLAAMAIKQRKPVVITHQQTNTPLPDHATAALYFPLKNSKITFGSLAIYSNQQGRKFDQNDCNLLGAVADYASVALENTRLFRELEEAKEREKQEIRRIFQTYVTPSVVERVIAHPASLCLGGTRQEVTTLFADIRGFTSLAEQTEPEHLISVLNEYLSVMAHTVLKYEGTMDKIMGDSVMAFFNAPSPQPDHSLKAVKAALAIQRSITELHRTSPIKLSVSIGLATGEAVVGHVGTTDLMNYTVIGDSVNLAKRLQEEAKPGQILINALAFKYVQDKVIANHLETVSLKGKIQTEPLYELVRIKQP
ncbi:MAG: response regulator [Anaerolineales bacterium]|nr:response regulator [Anaerolineales bacterium]